ncbi:hypothetical protein H0H81_003037 [Sphagnurus paluster]|uniref:Uncharacterized protein n=1 Tax=Sphagnurus paluster TaxID=117069 RepID=A0A9P7FSL7_9AGAR|nr:hypothetical protein H0H81_003037 [Sphagnurus paluster]
MTLFSTERGFFSNGLMSLPKLDKATFISSYLQEQTAHAKAYTSQGQSLQLSWDQEEKCGDPAECPSDFEEPTEIRLPSSLLVVDYGFGTPVLKPRVVKRPTPQVEDSPPNSKSPRPDIKVRNTTDEPRSKEGQTKRKRTTSGTPPKAIAKAKPPPPTEKRSKPVSESDLASEHAKRLKDRRERKRAKRAIMKPAAEDMASELLLEKKGSKKRNTKGDSNSRVPAGLALMHGFSATNVGPGRLTAEPRRRLLLTLRNVEWEARRIESSFAESDFLGQILKRPKCSIVKRKEIRSSGSDITSSADLEGDQAPQAKTKKTNKELKKHIKSAQVEKKATPTDQSSKSKNQSTVLDGPLGAKDVESINWDIELGSVILPSKNSLASESGKQTLLLDTRHVSWTAAISVKPPKSEADLQQYQTQSHSEVHIDTGAHYSNSSIGPSDSASQHRGASPNPKLTASSKYFDAPTLPTSRQQSLDAQFVTKSISKRVTACITSNKNPTKSDLSPILLNIPTNNSTITPVKPVAPSIHSIIGVEQVTVENYATDNPNDHHLDCLPVVDPRDYEYSEGDFRLWPPGQVAYPDVPSQGLMEDYATYIDDDQDDDLYYSIENSYNNRLSFHKWHELDGSFGYEHYSHATENDEQDCMVIGTWTYDEDDSITYDDDGYDSPEYHGFCNLNSNDNDRFDDSGSFLGYQTVDDVDETHASGTLDDDSQEKDHGSGVDLYTEDTDRSFDFGTGRFAQGRALLLGYSNDLGLGSSQEPSLRPKVSLVEADVAKGLRNHWLPQRL